MWVGIDVPTPGVRLPRTALTSPSFRLSLYARRCRQSSTQQTPRYRLSCVRRKPPRIPSQLSLVGPYLGAGWTSRLQRLSQRCGGRGLRSIGGASVGDDAVPSSGETGSPLPAVLSRGRMCGQFRTSKEKQLRLQPAGSPVNTDSLPATSISQRLPSRGRLTTNSGKQVLCICTIYK